ncbi:transcriptional regulator Brz [Haloplanus natans]|uniref:transcriptional regulator Brz n=1 Tax=Haloplanus natans TaxID=376171 RepID=UPI000A06C869
MPITELQCPRCGANVKIGLPRSATVKSISTTERPEPAAESLKVRSLCCGNGHEFYVMFEW